MPDIAVTIAVAGALYSAVNTLVLVLKHRGDVRGVKRQDHKDLVADLGNQIDREVALREKAEDKASKAEMETRLAKEHASELRRLLLENGVASADIPTQPWLTAERT